MMIIKINKRLHLYLAVLIHQIRLARAKRSAKRWTNRTGERALVLPIRMNGKKRIQAVRFSRIPVANRSRCMRRALFVAYPNGRKQ